MTLIVLFPFSRCKCVFFSLIILKNRELLCDFYAEEKFLGYFYLLKEFICNKTQNGPENALMENRRNTLSPKTNTYKERICNLFSFCKYKKRLVEICAKENV